GALPGERCAALAAEAADHARRGVEADRLRAGEREIAGTKHDPCDGRCAARAPAAAAMAKRARERCPSRTVADRAAEASPPDLRGHDSLPWARRSVARRRVPDPKQPYDQGAHDDVRCGVHGAHISE